MTYCNPYIASHAMKRFIVCKQTQLVCSWNYRITVATFIGKILQRMFINSSKTTTTKNDDNETLNLNETYSINQFADNCVVEIIDMNPFNSLARI